MGLLQENLIAKGSGHAGDVHQPSSTAMEDENEVCECEREQAYQLTVSTSLTLKTLTSIQAVHVTAKSSQVSS